MEEKGCRLQVTGVMDNDFFFGEARSFWVKTKFLSPSHKDE